MCVLESNTRYCYSVVIDVFVNDSSMETEDKKTKMIKNMKMVLLVLFLYDPAYKLSIILIY